MKQRLSHPDTRVPAPHISGAVVSDDGWIHVSGQGPLDMVNKEPVRGTIQEETLRTLENIEAIIGQAGCGRGDIVRCTCYLASLEDFDGFNAAYRDFFQVEVPPSRTTVQTGLLFGIKVEIDAVARRNLPVGD